MDTNEEKALKACKQYAEINAEIKELKVLIGNALLLCPHVEPPGHLRTRLQLVTHKERTSHLSLYYKTGNPDYLQECRHCQEADRFVQQRKNARQRLGAAKRWITRIGQS